MTLKISKTNYLSQVIDDNSRDPKSLLSQMNNSMHKKKENPLSEHSSAKSLADDYNIFFKEKVEKIRQTFSTNQIPAFDNDIPFTGLAFDQFQLLTKNDIFDNQFIKIKVMRIRPNTNNVA